MVPKPGTRSSISRSATFTSTENGRDFSAPVQASIYIEIEHAITTDRGYFTNVEPIKAIKPVGLIKPVFPHQRRLDERQVLRQIGMGLKAE